jgi:hypothetical protein
MSRTGNRRMPFVHSLVKSETNGQRGWCAPAELGEAAPHYVSFTVPVDEQGRFFGEYVCETVTAEGDRRRIESHRLVQQGPDSFVLRIGDRDFWFVVRTVPREDRRLPYVGRLRHPDFARSFAELEPVDLERLDSLFQEADTFVIGCEPFEHYSGISSLAKHQAG